jgi:DNA modification methylase
MKNKKIKLINGDCIEEMKKMADNSVDLIITSPPYNINNNKLINKTNKKGLINTVKYKNCSDDLKMKDYFIFIDNALSEMLRISKSVFFNIQILAGNKNAVYKIIGKYSDDIKEIIIWDKINAEPAACTGVLNSQFELILVFGDEPGKRKFDKAQFKRGTLSNVWKIKKEFNKNSEYHNAVFPGSLCTHIIKNFTIEGDIIADPFMGMGTTGMIAKLLNRCFIGIEKDKLSFKLSCKNILRKRFRRVKLNDRIIKDKFF